MFQLTAPNAICGRVIGRGGSKINSITVCNLIDPYNFIISLQMLLIVTKNSFVVTSISRLTCSDLPESSIK